jgi:hypothetical protein
MRKFILIAPLLFISAGAYAVASAGLTFAASEKIEQIRPAEKPAVATEPSARTNSDTTTKSTTKTNTDTAEPARSRKNAKPSASSHSTKRSPSPSRRTGESDEDTARRLGKQYGITW